MNTGAQYASPENRFERLGLDVLRRAAVGGDADLHEWTAGELDEIRRLERRQIAVAAIAGAISGTVIGAAEIAFDRWLRSPASGGGGASWLDDWSYWVAYVGVALVVSAVEVLYLYWSVLRTVARTSGIAGLGLSTSDIERVMAVGLSRAALEMPNPREPVYGIDPYARTSRWKLTAYALLYRVKVGATSFILRVLLRRLVARAGLRSFIPLVAIPIYATWNAVVVRWVMREARIRIAGPIAIARLGQQMRDARSDLKPAAREAIVEAVGECIARSEDAHPNFVLLVGRVFEALEIPPRPIRGDWAAVRGDLAGLDEGEQSLLLQALVATALLDGRIRRAERELLEEAHRICGRSFRIESLAAVRDEFLRGRGVPPAAEV
jgi:hypothetical protein